MAKINRKDAVERVAEMLNGRTSMTEAEFNAFSEEVTENCIADLKKSLHCNIFNGEGIIGTMHTDYCRVQIIEEVAEEEPKTEKKAKAPKVKEVQNYTNKKGKTFNAANMISNSRFAQMLHKGYVCQQVFNEETVQEAYDRLVETFETVRIYSNTKLENGKRTRYAMCR